mgnify:CR=1 FL=1
MSFVNQNLRWQKGSYHPSLSDFSLPGIRFLLNEAIDLNNKAKNINDLQKAADYFVKSCYNVRINYEKLFYGRNIYEKI